MDHDSFQEKPEPRENTELLDRAADRVFRHVRQDRLPVAWQFAMARVIEHRYQEPLQSWLRTADEPKIREMLAQMVLSGSWDSEGWIMGYIAGVAA
ncbi:hypothetical protein JKG47_01040 [Acidithiobacillus sp. MC6.1]|nr:hypothetical protein [Acidithiobacillus sp. MC6.1]